MKKTSPKLSSLSKGKRCRRGGPWALKIGCLRWGTSLLLALIRLNALTFPKQTTSCRGFFMAKQCSWKHQPLLPFPEPFLREVLQSRSNQKSTYEFWLPCDHPPTASSKIRLEENIYKVLMCNPRSPLTFSHLLVLMRGSLLRALLRCPLTMHFTSLQHVQTGFRFCCCYPSVRSMLMFVLFLQAFSQAVPSLLLQRRRCKI